MSQSVMKDGSYTRQIPFGHLLKVATAEREPSVTVFPATARGRAHFQAGSTRKGVNLVKKKRANLLVLTLRYSI